MEATILKISSSLSDKEKLFQEIVHAVEGWGSFLEIYNKIKSQLNHSKDTKNNLEELHSRKNRFIKVIDSTFSSIWIFFLKKKKKKNRTLQIYYP